MSPHAEHRAGAPRRRIAHELADVIRLCGEAFVRANALSREQSRAMRDVAACRTNKLGGHLDVCGSCGVCRPSYNSCRNRHCPKCQALRQAQWVDARTAKLLPTHHFHVVFTLPAELRRVALRHRAKVFEMLFACAWSTLATLATDRLEARLAVTSVLHTWSRDLSFHPHIHCIVSGGGYDHANDRWVASGRKFLFPVLVMGKLFRGKMLAALRAAIARGELDLADDDPESLLGALYRKRWVVYAKRPFGDIEQVVRYLGLYTHRVGISNQRIESITDAAVRFRTRDSRHATVTPTEFLRRFLLHVLPTGFVKIRHFGLLAPGLAQRALERARAKLARPAVPSQPPTAPRTRRSGAELLLGLLGIDVRACSVCRERARTRQPLDDAQEPTPITRDTS